MAETKFDLLLHPIRMRIILAFTGDVRLTAQELGHLLADVPPASLYRHLNMLVEGGVLVGTEERRPRGPAERVFTLPEERLAISPDELARASPADHMRYFTTFIAGLLGSFSRYLRRPSIDFERDGVGYRQTTLHLSDEELSALVEDFETRMRRELANEPQPDRRARVITRIVLPGEQPVEEGR